MLHSFIGWGRHPHVSLRKNYHLSLCGNLQIIDPTNTGYVPECRHSGQSKCAYGGGNFVSFNIEKHSVPGINLIVWRVTKSQVVVE